MTEREKFHVGEMKEQLFSESLYMCENCGGSIYQYCTPQLAHRISGGKMNTKKYGKHIVNHCLNFAATCSLKCNDAMNIGNNPGKVADLINKINLSGV